MSAELRARAVPTRDVYRGALFDSGARAAAATLAAGKQRYASERAQRYALLLARVAARCCVHEVAPPYAKQRMPNIVMSDAPPSAARILMQRQQSKAPLSPLPVTLLMPFRFFSRFRRFHYVPSPLFLAMLPIDEGVCQRCFKACKQDSLCHAYAKICVTVFIYCREGMILASTLAHQRER